MIGDGIRSALLVDKSRVVTLSLSLGNFSCWSSEFIRSIRSALCPTTQASSGVALSMNSKLFSRVYIESLMYISTESMLNKIIGVETISN
jgi:hypothetical protein